MVGGTSLLFASLLVLRVLGPSSSGGNFSCWRVLADNMTAASRV